MSNPRIPEWRALLKQPEVIDQLTDEQVVAIAGLLKWRDPLTRAEETLAWAQRLVLEERLAAATPVHATMAQPPALSAPRPALPHRRSSKR